jgi:hypothetical protein
MERRYGFANYRFTEKAGELVSGRQGEGNRDEWQFRGTFTTNQGFIREYFIVVCVRSNDEGDGLRWERIVNATVLEPQSTGIAYVIEVPALGEKGTVSIKETEEISPPEVDDDVLSALDELMTHDHLGDEELEG